MEISVIPYHQEQNHEIGTSFVLIDDYSRYMWNILLKENNEAFQKFNILKKLVEQETMAKIIAFRMDRGGEFVSREFNSYCEDTSIKRQLMAPYKPQQNGVVERSNKTLVEMSCSILKHMMVPNFLWREAIRHSTSAKLSSYKISKRSDSLRGIEE